MNMILRNPFPMRVKLLYQGTWRCWKCGTNGQARGGLEIHHIVGRGSAAAFNSSLLCRMCHDNVTHTRQEQQALFKKTFLFLDDLQYKPEEDDYEFLNHYWMDLGCPQVGEWLVEKNKALAV